MLATDTDILKAAGTDREAKRRILARTPLGRIGEPDEIAAIAVFLAGLPPHKTS